ncbi:Multidrug resistance protein fnx1 [Cladophialophora carrionii]|uniref:Multidrug resistance protein fnx1 n=1 Tax=Cladophialophora carrionii TaxID=86049 RepID=A0A1C1CXC1_9EURO|nr:Multidrug resistance protein fnx1 [Cladophialophora carrionii]
MAYTIGSTPDDNSPGETDPLLSAQNNHTGTVVRVANAQPDDTAAEGNDDATDAAAAANNDHAHPPSTNKLVAIMASTWIGVFFAALDTTIVATLTAPISSSFDSLSLLSWLATGYLIANAACQPLSGKLTDIFSRRWGLLFSNVFFGAGTLVCGLAPDAGTIIAGRVIAGIGGGGLTCITTYITSDLIPLRRRGLWQGYGNLVYGLGMGLGGPVGGVLSDRLSWRWAFLLQVPFIVVSTVLVFFLVDINVQEHGQAHRQDGVVVFNNGGGNNNNNNNNGNGSATASATANAKSALARIDFLGSGFLVASLVLLLLGLNTGGNQLPWTHPLVMASLALSAVTLGVFVHVESNLPGWVPEPILPVALIGRTRTVLAACLANWFGTMSAFLAIYYVPLYLQIRGLSATSAGLRVVPLAAATSAGSLLSGLAMRATGRYYLQMVGVMVIFVVGAALICTFGLATPTWMTFIFPVPLGFAYGGMLTVTLVGMISSVAHEHQAVITAASYAFRSTGSTIGITVAGAVFQNILTKELRAEFGGLEGSDRVIRRLKDSLEGIKHLPDGWDKDVVMAIYMHALRGAFISGLGLAVLAAVAGLGMKEHVLHKTLARK